MTRFTREACPPGSRAYTVRYVHKISPSHKDTSGPVCINDNAFSNSKTLGAALRKAQVMIGGAQVRGFRVEGDKVIVFPSAPGLTTYWHSIILTIDDDNVDETREGGGHRVAAADDAPEEIGTIGDVNFAEHGGGLVFRRPQRQEDIYGDCFLELIEPPSDDLDFNDPSARWTVYSVELDPEVPSWGNIEEVVRSYDELTSKELKADFGSTDPMRRVLAYETWAGYYGWHEFDQYARQLTCVEMNERYNANLDCEGDDHDDE